MIKGRLLRGSALSVWRLFSLRSTLPPTQRDIPAEGQRTRTRLITWVRVRPFDKYVVRTVSR
jgi:hypothetical protein